MKYLKRFVEKLSEEDLQELCDNYLTFLKDKGFTIKVGSLTILIAKVNNENDWLDTFYISDVIDDLFPFVELLMSKEIDDDAIVFRGYSAAYKPSDKDRGIKVLTSEDFLKDIIPTGATCKGIAIGIN
jgi:hypothetical protein